MARKLYTITVSEIMAEQIMPCTESAEQFPTVVNKFAEVTPVFPRENSEVTVKLTGDELQWCFCIYMAIKKGEIYTPYGDMPDTKEEWIQWIAGK